MKSGDVAAASSCGAGLLVVLLLVAGVCNAPAQQDRSYDKSYDRQSSVPSYNRTKAAPVEESRAEKEAERLVSLSADKILSLLTNEPGLLLECKKLLVRTAFEQGRLLDPQDLTDDAVFELVRRDQNIRSMFTQEIEDRYYVRAKPKHEELEQDWLLGLVPSVPGSSSVASLNSATNTPPNRGAALAEGNQSQESGYWARHEDDLQRTPLPTLNSPSVGPPWYTAPPSNLGTVPGLAASPSGGPSPAIPQQNNPPSVPYDSRRALLQAQSSQAFGDSGSATGGPMSRIAPDQMSALIAARMSNGGPSMNGLGSSGDINSLSKRSMIGSMGSPFGVMPGDASSLSSLKQALRNGSGNVSALGGTDFSQQAGLDMRSNSLGSPFLPPIAPDRQTPVQHRPDPYADVPSLYDLYQQYAHHSPDLDRFGINIFQNGTGNFDQLPMDMPVGLDYVVGPGDDLNIGVTGSISDQLTSVVDRQGRIILPDVGGVEVSGKSLGDVQQLVQRVLRTQYRDVRADVSLARLRTVRIYVVGDVERAGAYDVSALSTPLNALYEAGGPTSAGSLRIIKHYRGDRLIETVDVYDLLLHGIRSQMQRLESGDTVLVPPLGPQITVEGMVRRPAIYELKDEKSLAEVLELAGGILPTGTLRHVDVERVIAHDARSMLRLDIPQSNDGSEANNSLQHFQIQDGDRVQISPILPYAEKTVYLDGHVFRPGKFAYREGMKVTDLIKSYKDLLPEPYKKHAEIIRLSKPDNMPEVVAFNLDDALSGKDQDLVLQPFDTVRVFGRFDFEDSPVITVTGEVRDPGDHVTNGSAHIRDAIYLAGGTAPDALLSDAQVFRKTDDGKLRVIDVDLQRALEGDPKDNILLSSKDRIFIHKDLNKVDPPTVTVEGEVARPGKYPLGGEMTAATLVRFAGGLKRSAFTQEADLTTYMIQNGSKVVGDYRTVEIGKALNGEPDTDVRLRDGDVLTIRQLSGWEDVGATITVKGEIAHPGTYGIRSGERLSSILSRAGGFLTNAYPYGAIFERVQVRELQEQNRADLIQRVQAEATQVKLLPGMDVDDQVKAKAAVLQYKRTIETLQNTPPTGRLVIHISSDLKRWANTSADLQVRTGDVIFIPKRPNVVLISGAVYNPTAVTFKPGKSAGWYLGQAGGPTDLADKKATFVVRADGSVVGGSGSLFSGGVASAELRAGDMVVVPEQTYSFSNRFKTSLQMAQIAASVGVATYYFARF